MKPLLFIATFLILLLWATPQGNTNFLKCDYERSCRGPSLPDSAPPRPPKAEPSPQPFNPVSIGCDPVYGTCSV